MIGQVAHPMDVSLVVSLEYHAEQAQRDPTTDEAVLKGGPGEARVVEEDGDPAVARDGLIAHVPHDVLGIRRADER